MAEYKKIALIPAYEPEPVLAEVAAGLKRNGFEIVVVDDGSSWEYNSVFQAVSVYSTVLVHVVNKGKGAALKTGIGYIAENYEGPYTVVCVDADGQHKVEDAVRVCEQAAAYPGTLVLGSRRFTGKVPLRSRLGNTITRYVFRLTSGGKVYDTQTGLRAFSDGLCARLLEIEGERYEYEMNMLMVFTKEKLPVKEVWIETVYIGDNSSSHFNTLRDSARVYKGILKYSASSFVSFCADYLMYCIFLAVTGNLIFSNAAARVISGTLNYTLNRNVVFKSKVPVVRSVLQYFCLAVIIFLINTALLKGLAELGLNSYFAKIPVELVMAVANYCIQNRVIFAKESEAV